MVQRRCHARAWSGTLVASSNAVHADDRISRKTESGAFKGFLAGIHPIPYGTGRGWLGSDWAGDIFGLAVE